MFPTCFIIICRRYHQSASHENLDDLTSIVNCEFKKLTQYFRKNLLALHPKKTQFMVFSSKKIDPTNIRIVIDNNDVPIDDALYNPQLVIPLSAINDRSEVPAIKFLGVYIDTNLNFKYHVKQVANKISKALYFIRTAKSFLTLPALKSLYYALIHCHLIYALPIWSCTQLSNLNCLILLQKKAIRLVTLSKYNDHTEPLFKKTEILPLPSLIEMTKIQVMHNFIQGFLPSTLMEEWELFINHRQDQYYHLRNHKEVFTPFAITTFSERLPLTSFPKIWNALGPKYQNNQKQALKQKLCQSKILFSNKNKSTIYLIPTISQNYIFSGKKSPVCNFKQKFY